MAGYTPLFSSIVTSSIWNEDNATRVVWITMLALSDINGVVEGSIPGLAHVARVSLEECEIAINTLMSPDKYSRTSENEGKRIHAIDGGWQIYNFAKFRRRAKHGADYYRGYRKKKKSSNSLEKEINNPKQPQTTPTRATKRNHAQPLSGCAFDVFWQAYPRKVGKGASRKAWEKIKPDENLKNKIITAVEQQKKSKQWTKDEGQYIPHPATWLNQERWEDEPVKVKSQIEIEYEKLKASRDL